jgi:heat shock protein HslJ
MILLLAMMSCKTEKITSANSQEEKVFWVNSSKVPCTGVAPMNCLEVQENSEIDEGKWTFFYSQIEGFDFKPGNRYRIKVKIEKLPDQVPADASSLRYRLVEVLEEYPDKRLRLSNIWMVEKLEDIENPKGMEKALTLEINVAERRYFGFSGCNTIRGAALGITEKEIVFGNGAMTRMYCGPEYMDLEMKYAEILKEIKQYRFSGSKLSLLDEEGKIRMVLKNVD